jgi:hypothetical protein
MGTGGSGRREVETQGEQTGRDIEGGRTGMTGRTEGLSRGEGKRSFHLTTQGRGRGGIPTRIQRWEIDRKEIAEGGKHNVRAE